LRDAFTGKDEASLQRVVERCLQADRALRYQSIDALILDMSGAPPRPASWLRWSAVGAVAVIAILGAILIGRRSLPVVPQPLQSASIAVLPFRANGESYLADGLSDGLTTDLAKQAGLTVIARNSARRFASDADLGKVGNELRVRYVLLGSVQRNAQNVRIDAQLVDTATEAHVWADHYDRAISDIFSAEDAIVRAITGKIVPRAIPPAAPKAPADPRVADLYLRARFFCRGSEMACTGSLHSSSRGSGAARSEFPSGAHHSGAAI
jgi:TolB-like protein